MKIGSSTIYALLGKSPLEAVQELQKNGIDVIELIWEYKHYYLLEKQASELRKTGADFSLHFPYFASTISHPDAGMRREHSEMVRKALGFAEEIQATHCVLHGGVFPDWYLKSDSPMKMEEFYDYFTKELRAVLKASGTRIVLENTCYGSLGSAYEHIVQIQKRITGLGFCLDFAHAVQAGKIDLLERFLKELKIDHVHVTDSFQLKDDHLAVGKGTLPIKETLQKLKAKGYDGKVIFEGLTFTDTIESVKMLQKMIR